ncbi:MAG: amidohydrolase family protein [Candidatus Bathyarchaeota archaeon]|nr:amidohydrolase family protein [Candidatus Bathyarchaeota archaeon]
MGVSRTSIDNQGQEKIITVDAHTHLGYDYVFEHDFNLQGLLMGMESNGIYASIVQPGTTFDLETVVKQHNKIAELSKKMPGRIFGMANPNPHLPRCKYCQEIERCVKDLGFVGVKLHPFAHAVNPNSSAGKNVFEAASDLGIPVMVHTGSGVPWSLPSMLIPIAREFPKLKIILAHSGGNLFAEEALIVAEICSNIYLETSWVPSSVIYRFCKVLGPNRVMFGSDHPENVATEITKFRSIGLSRNELEWCLGKTAIEVFNISLSIFRLGENL